MAPKKVAIFAYVNPDQLEKLQRMAEEKGESQSWVIRNLIDRAEETK